MLAVATEDKKLIPIDGFTRANRRYIQKVVRASRGKGVFIQGLGVVTGVYDVDPTNVDDVNHNSDNLGLATGSLGSQVEEKQN